MIENFPYPLPSVHLVVSSNVMKENTGQGKEGTDQG